MPQDLPADFAVTYEWQEGSLPPPDHYSYRIRIAADGGDIRFVPGYGFQNPPVWRETFPVSLTQRAELHAWLAETGPLPPDPQAARSVGGSLASLEWTAAGQVTTLSSQARGRERQRFDDLANAVRGLVPRDLWRDLQDRFASFQKGSL